MERNGNRSLKIVTPLEQKLILKAWDLVTGIIGFTTVPKCVRGRENIPQSPSYLVATNHRGVAEPAALLHAWDRWIYFMAANETFSIPVIGNICKMAGFIPVKRNNIDTNALRKAIDYLKTDQVIGIMPEGTRGRSDLVELNEFKEGAAYIAIAAGSVPIVPVGIKGAENMLALIDKQSFSKTLTEIYKIRLGIIKAEISINIGKPIVNYAKDRRVVSNLILESISNLLEE